MKRAEDRFALALATVMNEHGAEGWKDADRLPVNNGAIAGLLGERLLVASGDGHVLYDRADDGLWDAAYRLESTGADRLLTGAALRRGFIAAIDYGIAPGQASKLVFYRIPEAD